MTPPDAPLYAISPPPLPCPADCPECAEQDAQDWADIEDEHRAVLAVHDASCVAEAIADAFAIASHDDDETAWFVAAQLLDDGHSPCRCQQTGNPLAGRVDQAR